ncbi:MAG: hypothetical protein AAF721_15835 [Myxococcota bacterium]
MLSAGCVDEPSLEAADTEAASADGTSSALETKDAASTSGPGAATDDTNDGTTADTNDDTNDDTGDDTNDGETHSDGDTDASSDDGASERLCDDIIEYERTWWTGIGGEGAFAGGIAVSEAPDGTLYVEERIDGIQSISRLDDAGQIAHTWLPDFDGALFSRSAHQGLFAHSDDSMVAVGITPELWTGRVGLAAETIDWQDTIAFPEWDAAPVDVAVGSDGTIVVVAQIERLGPLVRDIVLAKYTPDGTRLWDTIVPNNVFIDDNHMAKSVSVYDDGGIVIVNRSAVVFHRYDPNGEFVEDVTDDTFGVDATPRFVDLDTQGRLVVGVASAVAPGQNHVQIRRYDDTLTGQWQVQLEDTGQANEFMTMLDADDGIVHVHDFGEGTTVHRIVDGRVVLSHAIDETARTTALSRVGDCSFVLTGQTQDENEDWQYWRKRYDPV